MPSRVNKVSKKSENKIGHSDSLAVVTFKLVRDDRQTG